MLSINEHIQKYIDERSNEKPFSDEEKGFLYDRVRMYLTRLHIGTFSLDKIADIKTLTICESIMIEEYDNNDLGNRAIRLLINYYIDKIKSKDFTIKDIPSTKLRKELVDVVIHIISDDEKKESTRKYEDIENVIRTKLVLNKSRNKYVLDKSSREEN